MVVASAGCVATFLPWADGSAGDGWITLVCFAAIFAIAARAGDRSRPVATAAAIGALVLSSIVVAVATLDMSRLQSVVGASAGPGLYLAAVAGVAIALIAGLAVRW
jgi:hypothetical protein